MKKGRIFNPPDTLGVDDIGEIPLYVLSRKRQDIPPIPIVFWVRKNAEKYMDKKIDAEWKILGLNRNVHDYYGIRRV